MKIKGTYKNQELNFSSYSKFYKWSQDNGLFAVKNGTKDFTPNTSEVIYTQKDGSQIKITNRVS